jgi:hypothetical protein
MVCGSHENRQTLGLTLFLQKGFRITETTKDHYKQGIDERMLATEPWREIVSQINNQNEAVQLLQGI